MTNRIARSPAEATNHAPPVAPASPVGSVPSIENLRKLGPAIAATYMRNEKTAALGGATPSQNVAVKVAPDREIRTLPRDRFQH